MSDKIKAIEAKLEAITDPREKVDLLNELAHELVHSDPQRGLTLASQAQKIAAETAHLPGMARSLLLMGNNYWHLSAFHQTVTLCEQSLELYRQLGDLEGQARAYNIIGISYIRTGDLPKALSNLLSSLPLFRERQIFSGESTALNNIGNVYLMLGDYETSLDYYYQCYRLKERIQAQDISIAIGHIGLVHIELHDYQQGLEYMHKALEWDRKTGDKSGEALTLAHIGEAYLKTQAYDRAMESFRQAQELAEQLGMPWNQAMALDGQASVHQELKQYDQAVKMYQDVLSIARRINDKNEEQQALHKIGQLSTQLGRYPEALEYLDQSLAIAEEQQAVPKMSSCHQALVEVYNKMGEYQSALDHYQKYHQLDKQVFNEGSDMKRQALMVRFQVEQAERASEIYRLKNIELVRANQELEQLNRLIHKGEEYRSKLMEQVTAQSQELERLAKTDGLTGLYNRRFLDEALALEFARSRRYHEPLTVAMLDIDHFKQVNDTASHHAGDEVLKIIAGILKANCRTVDLAARYGGEEFVLVFPNTGAAAAAVVCERIRAAVEGCEWPAIGELQVTVSIGLSDDLSLPNHEKLLSAADARMYLAKQRGRNRVIGP